MSRPVSVDLPAPGGPQTPSFCAAPADLKNSFDRASAASSSSTIKDSAREAAAWSPLRTRLIRSAGSPLRANLERPVQVLDDLGERRARTEHAVHARLLELGDVLVGDDAAAEDEDVLGPLLAQELHDLGEERQVRSGQGRQADRVDVLLHRRGR